MKKISVVKFGGGLLDSEGKTIPKVLKRIMDLSNKADLGPVVVFSAPSGYTNMLIKTGESYPHSGQLSVDTIFNSYESVAKRYVTGSYLKSLLSELKKYREQTYAGLALINRRFQGNAKAKVLTSGGELPTSVLMEYVLKANGFNSYSIPVEHWPIVTDDNFENATPLYDPSKERISYIIEPLEAGAIVLQAGFLGVTMDGLETTLGRGGSDLTAVFMSCLLKSRYRVETLLFKDLPVQSADPSIVNTHTAYVPGLTYNEAHKASLMGMKIVQGAAISMARRFKQPMKVVPIDAPEKVSVIKSVNDTKETVKCVTGKTDCAILSIHDEKSRSLEDSLRIWENRHTSLTWELRRWRPEKGYVTSCFSIQNFFLRKNEKKLMGFDEELTIEYGVGVVTLVGDMMRNSPGVASIAVGAMPGINIKRGIFAPHTSQIILVVEEENVSAALTAIHNKRDEMNRAL